MQVGLIDIGLRQHLEAHIIEALQGAHAGGTNGNSLAIVGQQFFEGLTAHADIFGVHLVTFNLFALNRLKRTCTHM